MCTVNSDYSSVELDADQQRLINEALAASSTTPPSTATPNGDGTGTDAGGFNTLKDGRRVDETGMGENTEGTVTAPPTGTAPPAVQPGDNAGQTSGNTGFNAQSYLAAYPGVLEEFARHTSKSDMKYLESLGVYTADDFAAYHYNTVGKAGGFNGAGTTVGNATGSVNQANDLMTNLTNGFNTAIDGLGKQLSETLTNLTNANNGITTGLTEQISELSKGFQTQQQQLLDGMNLAAAKQSEQFSKSLKDLKDAGNSSGQMAKKPNYGRALQRNKELNGGGFSSTSLTGPGGIAAGSGTLGRTSLLGA